MRVYSVPARVPRARNGRICTIGVFDGMHRGHQTLFRALLCRCRAAKCPATVITFYPHPHTVLEKERVPLILSLAHRLFLFSYYGAGETIIIPFDRALARLPADRFVAECLIARLGVRELIVGEDFRFGARTQADVRELSRLGGAHGVRVSVLKDRTAHHRKISSETIRASIRSNDLRAAARLLGRPVSFIGAVVRGRRIGTRLVGFPTANIRTAVPSILPQGVYAVRVTHGRRSWRGVMNIGTHPTFGRADQARVFPEVHVIGYRGDLYGRQLAVTVLARLREERSFPSAPELSLQIRKDIQCACRIRDNGNLSEFAEGFFPGRLPVFSVPGRSAGWMKKKGGRLRWTRS